MRWRCPMQQVQNVQMWETILSVVFVKFGCNHARIFHSRLPFDKYHSPCAARKGSFALCRKCDARLGVLRFAIVLIMEIVVNEGHRHQCCRRQYSFDDITGSPLSSTKIFVSLIPACVLASQIRRLSSALGELLQQYYMAFHHLSFLSFNCTNSRIFRFKTAFVRFTRLQTFLNVAFRGSVHGSGFVVCQQFLSDVVYGWSSSKPARRGSTVCNLDDALAAFFFTPLWWATYKSIWDSRRRHHASLTDVTDRLSIHWSEKWSVLSERCRPFRRRLRSSTTRTVQRHSISVVSFYLSALARERDQYKIGFFVLSGCFCINAHSTWTSKSFLCIVCHSPFVVRQGKCWRESSFCWLLLIASSSLFSS